jgi:hypothetical protein
MWNIEIDDEDKNKSLNPMVNTIFYFDMQMNNNCNNARFGIQRSKDDVLGDAIGWISNNIRLIIRSSHIIIINVGTINREIDIITRCV